MIAACQSIPEGSNSIIIICHGFRGAKENSGKLGPFAERLNNIGYGVLAFDFSGSGGSDGEFKDITLSGQARDLQCVINYVSMRYSLPIYLLGRSFGGSTVLAAGSGDPRVVGFILWSAPVHLHTTFGAMMTSAYDQLFRGHSVIISDEGGSFVLEPDLIRDFDHHDMAAYLNQIGRRPLLVIHGENDETVASENASYVYEKVPHARLHIVPGADHRFNGLTRQREDLTMQWLADQTSARETANN